MRDYKFDFKSLISKYDVNKVGLKDILQLANDVSINRIVADYKEISFLHTNTTYLYSGRVAINDASISTGDIANAFENARTLDQTVAAKFFYSDEYNLIFDTYIIKNRCKPLRIVGYNDFYLCHGL